MNEKTKMPQFLAKIHSWISRHHTVALIIAGIVLVVIASIVAFAVLYQKPVQVSAPTVKKQIQKIAPPIVYYSPLTGMKVNDEAATKQPVTAIMIENSPAALPPTCAMLALYEASQST